MTKMKAGILLWAIFFTLRAYGQFITSVASGSLTTSGATITWTTCAAADSQINYGLSAAYGSSTVLADISPKITSHSVAITALSSGVVYHYQVVSSDATGQKVVSPDGTFTTTGTAPAITAQPAAQTVCAGALATFTATASGGPAPTVQWQVDNGTGFANISGATSTTYSFTSAATQNGFHYRAVFTNATGTATTNSVLLTVNTTPAISAQPVSTSVVSGQNATFTATANGQPSPTVKWQTNSGGTTWTDLTNVAPYSGVTTTTLTITAATSAQNNYGYRAVFSNSCGSVNSNAAVLSVTSSTLYDLAYSTSSNRSSGLALQGATVSGTIYPFTTPAGAPTNFSPTGPTPLALLSSASGGAATSTAVTSVATSAFNAVAGATIVAVCRNGSNVQSAVSDTAGNAYAAIGTPTYNSSVAAAMQTFYAHNVIANAANVVKCTFPSSAYNEVIALQYPAGTFDVTANGQSAGSTSLLTGAFTTTAVKEILLACGTVRSTGNVFTAGSGYTLRITNAAGDTACEDQIVSSIQTGVTAGMTVSPTEPWIIIAATFKEAPAQVCYWLDNSTPSNPTGTPNSCDTVVPFDYAGTATGGGANPWTPANGTHTISQKVVEGSYPSEIDKATFTVSNTVHTVSLAWTAGAAYDSDVIRFAVKRATGACPQTTYNQIASSLSTASFLDTTVSSTSGTKYCYVVNETDITSSPNLTSPDSSAWEADIP